jgi:hypothetical protein
MRRLGRKLLVLGMLGAVGYLVYHQRPDIERYLKMRAM